MARPENLQHFVFDKLPPQAQTNFPTLPELPPLPEHGGGGEGHLPEIEFSDPALEALNNLPLQAHLPDWLLP